MTSGVALLVVDFQNDIVSRFGREAVAPAKGMIGWARASSMPVLYTKVAYRPDYLDASALHKPLVAKLNILRSDTTGSEIAGEVAPQDGDFVLVRHRVSAFYNSELELVLRTLSVRTLLLCGFSTSRAIESTAREAADRDLRAIVISDACAADTQDKHENALKSIADFFGEVMTAERVKVTFSR